MRVLIADDQRVVREGLATIVAGFSGAEVAATDDAARWTASAFSFSGRRALDGALVALALLLLAAEAFVTRAVAPTAD